MEQTRSNKGKMFKSRDFTYPKTPYQQRLEQMLLGKTNDISHVEPQNDSDESSDEPEAKRRRICAHLVVESGSMNRLDYDSLALIFCFLSCPKVMQLRLTNKHWDHVIMTSDYMWDQFIARDFYGALGEGKIVQVDDEPLIESELDDDEISREEQLERENEEEEEESEEEESGSEEDDEEDDEEDGAVNHELTEVTEEVIEKLWNSKAEEKYTDDREEHDDRDGEQEEEASKNLGEQKGQKIISPRSLSMKAYVSLYNMIPAITNVIPNTKGKKHNQKVSDEDEDDEEGEYDEESSATILSEERAEYRLASFSGTTQAHKLALILSLLMVNGYTPSILHDMVKIGRKEDYQLIPLSQFCYSVLTGRENQLYQDEFGIPSDEDLRLHNTNLKHVYYDDIYEITRRAVLNQAVALSPNIEEGFIPFLFYTFMRPTRKKGDLCEWVTDESGWCPRFLNASFSWFYFAEFVTSYEKETGIMTVLKKKQKFPVF